MILLSALWHDDIFEYKFVKLIFKNYNKELESNGFGAQLGRHDPGETSLIHLVHSTIAYSNVS